jgi:hypothetical protein
MGLRGDNKIFQYGPSRSYFFKKSWGIFVLKMDPKLGVKGSSDEVNCSVLKAVAPSN